MSKMGQYILESEEDENYSIKPCEFIERRKREHMAKILAEHNDKLGNLSTYEIMKYKFGIKEVGN